MGCDVRSVQWQGFSGQSKLTGGDAEQVEWDAVGTVRAQPARHLDGLVAFGEQCTDGLDVTWQLCTGPDWQTRRLDVRVVGTLPGRGAGAVVNRTLLLERHDQGWRSRAWSRDDLPPGALAVRPGLPGGELDQPVADVVIDGCPLSHWAPVRRLGLAGPRPTQRRGGPGRPLATAHPVLRVRLPDLAVVVTRQRYVAVRESGRERALEQSFAGGPAVPLLVDEAGVPLQFDGMRRRADSAMVA